MTIGTSDENSCNLEYSVPKSYVRKARYENLTSWVSVLYQTTTKTRLKQENIKNNMYFVITPTVLKQIV